MKKGPLFPKKEKQNIDYQIMEAGVRIRGLQRKYRLIIERELRALRYSRTRKRDNPKAVANLKNAYYSLAIINNAHERLREISSVQELCKAMNEMGAVLKLMNSISGRTEKVNVRALNNGIKGMEKAGQRDESGMKNFFRVPVDDLVDDSVIERLLGGESLEECLDMEEAAIKMEEILPFSEDELQNLDEENALEKSMADIDELTRDL